MKLSHRKAFKLIIDIQSKPISKSKQTRLDAHINNCEECQDFLAMKLDMKTTLPWKDSNNSRQRATQIKNAVRRDTRRYYMFSRLSKTVKTIAFIGIIGIALSAIILTKDNLEVTPASITNIEIPVGNFEESFLATSHETQFDRGNYLKMLKELYAIQGNFDFDINLPVLGPTYWIYKDYQSYPSEQTLIVNYEIQESIDRQTGEISFIQQKFSSSDNLEALIRKELKLSATDEFLFEDVDIVGNLGILFRGALADTKFYPYANQWEVSWIENNVLYRIILASNNYFDNQPLNLAGALTPLSKLYHEPQEINNYQSVPYTSEENYYLLSIAGYRESQVFQNFELKMPRFIPNGWIYDSLYSHPEQQYFRVDYIHENEITDDSTLLRISQQVVSPTMNLASMVLENLQGNQKISDFLQNTEVNGYPALFIRGEQSQTRFDQFAQKWVLGWIEEDIYYQIILHGYNHIPLNEMKKIGEYLQPIVEFSLRNVGAFVEEISQAQKEINFSIKIPTHLYFGWTGSFNYYNIENQSFVMEFNKIGVLENTDKKLFIIQKKVDNALSLEDILNEQIEISNDIPWQPMNVGNNLALFLRGWFLNDGSFDSQINRIELSWIENDILYSIVYEGDDSMGYATLINIGIGLTPFSEINFNE